MTHEFGHVIDNASDKTLSAETAYAKLSPEQGNYSNRNSQEAFAEAFMMNQLDICCLSHAMKGVMDAIPRQLERHPYGNLSMAADDEPETCAGMVPPESRGVTAGAEEGHPFQGNQWTTGQHEKVQRPSKFVAPDGDPMTRNQIGDTMEALAAHHPAISAALAERFGGPVRAVRGEQAGSNRAGPWDLEAGNSGIELKSIHAESSQIKIRMKSAEIEDKKVEIVKAGLEPATAALVWQPTDDGGATAHLFAIDGVASGSLQKFDNLGAFEVTPEQYREAFTTAGYGEVLQAAGQLVLEFGDVEGQLDDAVSQAGTWDEVRRARNRGLITSEQYMELVKAMAANV